MTIDYCEVKRCRQQSALQWLKHFVCWKHWVLYADDKLDLRKEFGMPAIVRSDDLMVSDEGLADSTGAGTGEIEADKEGEDVANTPSPSTASVNWVTVKETLLF